MGKYFFGDKDVTGLEPEELGIGLVFKTMHYIHTHDSRKKT